MKRTLLLLMSLCLLGCMQNNTPNPQSIENGSIVEYELNGDKIEESRELSIDPNRTGVFNEKEMNKTSYPKTSLNWLYDFNELDAAIDDYYIHELTQAEKETNLKPIKEEDLNVFQEALNEHSLLSSLEAEVDQIIIQFENKENYIARITVPYNYQTAEKLKKDQDMLFLSEAQVFLDRNRLVLINYFDRETDEVVPIHLANSKHAIFFNENQAQTN